MDLQFVREDLDKWAHFSGDYNPIHFDEQFAAGEFGLDGVVVHGMLAMLPLKGKVSRINWGTNDWVQWRAMLKHAMPLKNGYSISMDDLSPTETRRFSLIESKSRTKSITGSCAAAEFDVSTYPTAPRFHMEEAHIREKLREFRENYPSVDGLWVFLDALVFSEYMANHSRSMFQEELFEHYGIDAQSSDLSHDLMVMHTTHTITATASLVGLPLIATPSKIGYDTQKKGRVITKDAVFALVDLPVWVNGQLELVIEMGVMARPRA